jgi:signal transduction histidine kinase
VSDDGAGYDARRTPMGSGLGNMADRLAALGGTLEIRSAPGQGTTITGHLPAALAHRSSTRSPAGWEQQINALPAAGASTGSGA